MCTLFITYWNKYHYRVEFDVSFQGFSHFFQKIITKKIKLWGGNPHSVVSQCLVDISGYIKQRYLRYNVVR